MAAGLQDHVHAKLRGPRSPAATPAATPAVTVGRHVTSDCRLSFHTFFQNTLSTYYVPRVVTKVGKCPVPGERPCWLAETEKK